MLPLHTTVGRVEMPCCCYAKTMLSIYDIITCLDKVRCPGCMRQRAGVGNGATIEVYWWNSNNGLRTHIWKELGMLYISIPHNMSIFL